MTMLFYKAWLESRTRFFLGAITIAGLIALFVFMNRDGREVVADKEISYAQYLWSTVYKGYLREIFVVVVLLMGMGGLARESAYGTVGFTLALPVSRWRLAVTRSAVGVAELTIIAFLPATLLPLLSPLVHETYPWPQAIHFGALWSLGGAVFFGMGVLASVVFAGEYSAPVAAVLFMFAYSIVADLPGVERYLIDINDFMKRTGPQGSSALVAVAASAIVLIAVAAHLTRRKDF